MSLSASMDVNDIASSYAGGSYLDKSYGEIDGSSIAGDSIFEGLKNTLAKPRQTLLVAVAENKRVHYAKIFMSLVLLGGVLALSVGTYQLVSAQETQEFETQFERLASEAIAVCASHITNTFGTIESFGETVSSYALDRGAVWPNVTIPHFPSRAQNLLTLTDMTHASINLWVPESGRLEFEEYVQPHLHPQVQEVLDYQGLNQSALDLGLLSHISAPNRTYDPVQEKVIISGIVPETKPGPYLVNWQKYPYSKPYSVMWNAQGNPSVRSAFVTGNVTGVASISFATTSNGIQSQIIQPVFDQVETGNSLMEEKKIVGMVWIYGDWSTYFQNLIHAPGDIYAVMKSSCGFNITYKLNGLTAESMGTGDHHDPKYDDYEVSGDLFVPQFDRELALPDGVCVNDLTLHLYPSNGFEQVYTTNEPVVYALGVVLVFVFTSAVFLIYDCMVKARQSKVMERVVREDKILAGLFPAGVRDRMYEDHDDGDRMSEVTSSTGIGSSARKHMEMFSDDVENPNLFKSVPIADLYLSATIVYADIVGFNAWSSAREPHQVFMLLETIYASFDKLSNTYGVFKVETVGDCYVAAAGVPDIQKDHAVLVAKFAFACLRKFKILTPKLEVSLGPDTGDLKLRMAIHSGQVTGGVLRGERARYQLFGDTVNTTAKLESRGCPGRIHVSEATAALLRERGREKWLTKRSKPITLQGKVGEMQTYWLERLVGDGSTHHSSTRIGMNEESESESEFFHDMMLESDKASMSKKDRLVEWNTEVLSQLLQQIIVHRRCVSSSASLSKMEREIGKGQTVLEEFQEIIVLPKHTDEEFRRISAYSASAANVELGPAVVDQLRKFIGNVANMYRDNSFHNWEHASHVAASVKKLLTRIVSQHASDKVETAPGLVDRSGQSFGITSDPLTQFAVVFSAVIHDADHPGIPNSQMIKEGNPLAAAYKEKSVAEQNSVDLCWELLLKPEYIDLRQAIYSNEEELQRFRQLVVNVVMATDIVDKELQALRKNRWNVAFSEEASEEGNPDLEIDRKATIVIEHLIQASDVSHTMQHWNIYLQWNERFFFELYKAYKEGRAETDPSVGWYKGEIGFFQFYVIPLAKKLATCGVFGVSSDEYLNYAESNMEEWKIKGEEIVAGYLEKFEKGLRGPPSGLKGSLILQDLEDEDPWAKNKKIGRAHV